MQTLPEGSQSPGMILFLITSLRKLKGYPTGCLRVWGFPY